MGDVPGADDARPARRRPRIVAAAVIAAVVVVGLAIAAIAHSGSSSSASSSNSSSGSAAATTTTRRAPATAPAAGGPTTNGAAEGPGGTGSASGTTTRNGAPTTDARTSPTTTATAKPGGPALVPSLVGTPLGAARASVEKAGFVVALVFKSSILQKGLVLDSVPGAGARAARGSTVTLYISRGDLVDVPSWVGLVSSSANMDQIRTEARASGLRVGFDGTANCSSKGATVTGRFVAQSPAGGGQFPRGTTVILTAKCPA